MHKKHNGLEPGLATPAHSPSSATGGIEELNSKDHAEAKRFAALQTRFALAGHILHQSGPSDGPGPASYLAVKWGMARYLPTLADTEQFLIQVGDAQ